MISMLMLALVKLLVWLRYRVTVRGLERIARRGRRGILFLPNHPALLDPFIVFSRLFGRFRVRPLADKDQIDVFFVRLLARRVRVLSIPDMTKVGSSVKEASAVIDECVKALSDGDNIVLYPAGQNYRGRLEDLGASRAAWSILRQLPDVRIVLIRTRGLWGSSFSWASGEQPNLGRVVRNAAVSLLASGVFFAPRRDVSIELHEPADLPRRGNRDTINRYLEAFYNVDAPPNTYVPYTIWEPDGPRVVPEPEPPRFHADLSGVADHTREVVARMLERLTDRTDIPDDARLAADLGMDSLSKLEMITEVQAEFGHAIGSVETLQTVGDVLLAAGGEATGSGRQLAIRVPAKWSKNVGTVSRPPDLASMTIAEAFLWQARRNADKVAIADAASGVKTYRDLVLACLALQDEIAALPGERLGIMMPATVGAAICYLATVFAGKTPVMVNWTLGRKNLLHCLDSVGVQRVLTATEVVARLRSQGVDVEAIADRIVTIEEIGKRLSTRAKIAAKIRSRLSWRRLRRAKISPTAAVLFTSGSENLPKSVPLSHRNVLINIADSFEAIPLRPGEIVLGILPPFHSFGLTASMVLPLVLGARTVYSPNPTDGAMLARMIHTFRATLLMGTPTFLAGIVRASTNEQMTTLRLVFSGAEKCSQRVYESLADRCPGCVVLEGYGITECSPIVSVNRTDDPRAGTIGKVLASLEHVIVTREVTGRVATGEDGLLLVRGPSIFEGYLNYDGPSPFVEFEGRRWYRTGDLVREDADGVLTFAGRLKRFVKLGGEMISLPAIEAVLEPHFAGVDDEGPSFAVVATDDDERPEIVLFTVRQIDRESVNRLISEAGLSGLHNVRRVVRLSEPLPVLGTGKTDYRALAERLARGGDRNNHQDTKTPGTAGKDL